MVTSVESRTTALAAGASGATSQGNNAVQDFLDYAKMSPTERMREEILKSLGMTEQQFEKLLAAGAAAIFGWQTFIIVSVLALACSAATVALDTLVESQAPFDQRRIDAERIPASGQFGYRYLAVGRAEAKACGPPVGELG